MDQNEIISAIAGLIRNKKKEVSDLIVKYGGTEKHSDSDIATGKELSKVLLKSADARKDLAAMIEGNQAVGALVGSALSGITSIFGGSQQAKLSEQQGSDAITLALINAGIEKQKKTNWPLILGMVALFIVLLIIGILLYQKYKRK